MKRLQHESTAQTAGNRAIEPLAIDPETIAEQLQANLQQAAEHWRHLAAQTLALAGQAVAS
ncbi:hypothetical protein [Streptomyces sp. NRRL B-24484]|uniref:hypothetical protein n=1 Tax=Streptomyces sp. NRRL B-24484 TaxID=1463833 RepID=UPI0004C12B4D|nr:hypothetical protein [Streptomyces sp. NRRL B-24484]